VLENDVKIQISFYKKPPRLLKAVFLFVYFYNPKTFTNCLIKDKTTGGANKLITSTPSSSLTVYGRSKVFTVLELSSYS